MLKAVRRMRASITALGHNGTNGYHRTRRDEVIISRTTHKPSRINSNSSTTCIPSAGLIVSYDGTATAVACAEDYVRCYKHEARVPRVDTYVCTCTLFGEAVPSSPPTRREGVPAGEPTWGTGGEPRPVQRPLQAERASAATVSITSMSKTVVCYEDSTGRSLTRPESTVVAARGTVDVCTLYAGSHHGEQLADAEHSARGGSLRWSIFVTVRRCSCTPPARYVLRPASPPQAHTEGAHYWV